MAELNVSNPTALPDVGLEVTAQPVNLIAQPGASAGSKTMRGLSAGLQALSKGYDVYAAAKTESLAKSEQEKAFLDFMRNDGAAPALTGEESTWYKETAGALNNQKIANDLTTMYVTEATAKLEDPEFLKTGDITKFNAEFYKTHAAGADPDVAMLLYPQLQDYMAKTTGAFHKGKKAALAQQVLTDATATVNSYVVQMSKLPATPEAFTQLQGLMDKSLQESISKLGQEKGTDVWVSQMEYGMKTLGVLGIADALKVGNYGRFAEGKDSKFLSQLNSIVSSGEAVKSQMLQEQKAKAEREWKLDVDRTKDRIAVKILQGGQMTTDEINWLDAMGDLSQYVRMQAAKQVDTEIDNQAVGIVGATGYNATRAGGVEKKLAQRGFEILTAPRLAAVTQSKDTTELVQNVMGYLDMHRGPNSEADIEPLQLTLAGASLEPPIKEGGKLSDRANKALSTYKALNGDPRYNAYTQEGSKLFNKEDLQFLQNVDYLTSNNGMTPVEAINKSLEIRSATGFQVRKEQVSAIRQQLDAKVQSELTDLARINMSTSAITDVKSKFYEWMTRTPVSTLNVDQAWDMFNQKVLQSQFVEVQLSKGGISENPLSAGFQLVTGAASERVFAKKPTKEAVDKMNGWSPKGWSDALTFNTALIKDQTGKDVISLRSSIDNRYIATLSDNTEWALEAPQVWSNYEKYSRKDWLAGQNVQLLKAGAREEAIKAIAEQQQAQLKAVKEAQAAQTTALTPRQQVFLVGKQKAQNEAANIAGLPAPGTIALPATLPPALSKQRSWNGPIPSLSPELAAKLPPLVQAKRPPDVSGTLPMTK